MKSWLVNTCIVKLLYFSLFVHSYIRLVYFATVLQCSSRVPRIYTGSRVEVLFRFQCFPYSPSSVTFIQEQHSFENCDVKCISQRLCFCFMYSPQMLNQTILGIFLQFFVYFPFFSDLRQPLQLVPKIYFRKHSAQTKICQICYIYFDFVWRHRLNYLTVLHHEVLQKWCQPCVWSKIPTKRLKLALLCVCVPCSSEVC